MNDKRAQANVSASMLGMKSSHRRTESDKTATKTLGTFMDDMGLKAKSELPDDDISKGAASTESFRRRRRMFQGTGDGDGNKSTASAAPTKRTHQKIANRLQQFTRAVSNPTSVQSRFKGQSEKECKSNSSPQIPVRHSSPSKTSVSSRTLSKKLKAKNGKSSDQDERHDRKPQRRKSKQRRRSRHDEKLSSKGNQSGLSHSTDDSKPYHNNEKQSRTIQGIHGDTDMDRGRLSPSSITDEETVHPRSVPGHPTKMMNTSESFNSHDSSSNTFVAHPTVQGGVFTSALGRGSTPRTFSNDTSNNTFAPVPTENHLAIVDDNALPSERLEQARTEKVEIDSNSFASSSDLKNLQKPRRSRTNSKGRRSRSKSRSRKDRESSSRPRSRSRSSRGSRGSSQHHKRSVSSRLGDSQADFGRISRGGSRKKSSTRSHRKRTNSRKSSRVEDRESTKDDAIPTPVSRALSNTDDDLTHANLKTHHLRRLVTPGKTGSSASFFSDSNSGVSSDQHIAHMNGLKVPQRTSSILGSTLVTPTVDRAPTSPPRRGSATTGKRQSQTPRKPRRMSSDFSMKFFRVKEDEDASKCGMEAESISDPGANGDDVFTQFRWSSGAEQSADLSQQDRERLLRRVQQTPLYGRERKGDRDRQSAGHSYG